MKKINLLLALFVCLLFNQSFSQKSKPDIKPNPAETKKAIKNQGSKAYCSSTYTNTTDDWITNVSINTINNYSGQNGANSYGDYTYLSTDLSYGIAYTLDVSFYSDGFTQHVWLFIDWNHNDIFDTEESYDLGEGVNATLTFFVGPPNDALPGNTRLRVIEQYSTDPGPCDPHQNIYGETEDYTINVYGNENYWTGAVDNNWHNAANWLYNFVPDATTDVTIWDVTNKCWVWAGPAYCNNITVDYGSGYDLKVSDQNLNVSANMNFYGELLMDHTDGRIIAEGDIIWESGSRASILANAVIEVYGDWIFKSGANVTMDDGVVGISGSGSSYIRTFEDNCYFNDLVIYKSSSDWASIGSTNTADMHIHGDLGIEPGSVLYMYTPKSVFLQGDLLNLGSFLGYDGTLVFDGSEQMIFGSTYGSIQLFHNLTISSDISTTISGNSIEVEGNLAIEEGQLISGGYTIEVGGNWDNQVGPGGFDPGAGTVRINGGNYHQYCSNETFFVLEVDKPLGGALRMQGTHVECEHYDWTAGAIDVVPGGGSFTAFNLIDDGIYGAYYLNPGGTINLYDLDIYSNTDLNGELHIFGGVMNVYGNATSCWLFAGDALISMSDGVLDFHGHGIVIYNSSPYTLTENISGGTIRTEGSFLGACNEFTPDYGTLEFYGSTDAFVYTANGCYLNNVLINKSNTLSLIEFLDINGNLVIDNGILDANGFDIQIEGDWTNFVGDAGFVESTGDVFFNDNDNTGSIIHTNETFNDLTLYNASSGIYGLTLMDGIVVNVKNLLDIQHSALEMNFASALNVDGDIFIAYGGGLNADDGNNVIEIGGSWTNENNSNTTYIGFWPGGETVIFNGYWDQIITAGASQESFSNLVIDKPLSWFSPNDDIYVIQNFTLQNGTWRDNVNGLSHSFEQDFIVNAGGYFSNATNKNTVNLISDKDAELFFDTPVTNGIFNILNIDKSTIIKSDNGGPEYKNAEKHNNKSGPIQNDSKSQTVNMFSDVFCGNDAGVSIQNGTLNLNGHTFTSTGDLNINSNGIMNIDAGAILKVNSGHSLNVNNNGALFVVGSPGNEATVTRYNLIYYYYQFNVNSGGTIAAENAVLEYIDMYGVNILPGAIVDPSMAFNYCTFQNVQPIAASSNITFSNDQVLTCTGANFPDNPFYNVCKDNDVGEITFTAATGDFAGPMYEYDPYNRIHWGAVPFSLDVTVFLEGPFNPATNLMEHNPSVESTLNQPFGPALPYFGNLMPDWYYTGSEFVSAPFPANVVDWVLVELRDAPDVTSALPVTSIAKQAAFITTDGKIVDLDAVSNLTFSASVANGLFIVVWQRNHAGVISAIPITLPGPGSTVSYNFSTGAGHAFGGTSAQKQLSTTPEIWGMFSGDGDGNGEIQLSDKVNVWDIQAGEAGYLESDFNLNGDVNNQDKNDYWWPNNGYGSFIPE